MNYSFLSHILFPIYFSPFAWNIHRSIVNMIFFLFFVMCGYLFPLYFYMFYSSFVMLLCKTKRQIIFINRLLICILFPFLVMVKFVSGDFHQRFDDNFRNQPDDAEINYCGLINRWPPNERSILTFRGFNCFIQNSVFF